MYPKTVQTERKLLHRLASASGGVLTLLSLSSYYRDRASYKRLPLLERAVGVHPYCQDARVWFHLGEAMEKERSPHWIRARALPPAYSAYRRATELDPSHSEAWFAQARCLSMELPLEPIVDAIVHALQSAIQADPGKEHYWCRLGAILAYGPCRPEEAAAAYEQGLELRRMGEGPGWEWFQLAGIYHHRLRRHADAERCVLKAIEIDSPNPGYMKLLDSIRQAEEGRRPASPA